MGECVEMGKIPRFCGEAGALGLGSVSFAFISWVLAAVEHHRDKNAPAFWLILIGCAFFCIGCFKAWWKADDRANARRPQLGFSADANAFYLTHLEGAPARSITIDPIIKYPNNPLSIKLHFDPVDFLSAAMTACKTALTCRLENIPGKKEPTGMPMVRELMFSSLTKPSMAFPVTVRFLWNGKQVQEKWVITWISETKRFETRQQ
jgi:hypothetical protein